jgi:AcrR family transcriptional regulator
MASKNVESRQKIINKALDLFYNQGYKATGINQVISESGVSKNTFYYHFPSKDALCVTYLQEMDKNWRSLLKDKINKYKDLYDKLFAPIEFVKEWNINNNFRGCPFLNIASEVTDTDSSIRKEVIFHKDGFRTIIRELLKDIKKSDNRYSKIDISFFTDAYYVALEGSIAASQNYGETWPFETTRKNIERLLLA